MIQVGDIVKNKSGSHFVIGSVDADGFVAHGYKVSDREEYRIVVADVEVVYSTNERITRV